jgi:hypothetical protein
MESKAVIEWMRDSPFLTFFIVLAALSTVGMLFKAIGGGYLPRRHCNGCTCYEEPECDDDA